MQLAAGIAGAVVGSFFGMPQLGWAIGSAVGGSLLAPDIQGPKLSDLKVQIASYGAGIPRMWGTAAIAGNVIWATNKVPHETSQSAKGGPETITTSYTCSFAVLLCEATAGVTYSARRIWANSRKAYDISADASPTDQAASAEFAEFFTLYSGGPAQLPDPTMESFLGVGNVPAYRDYVLLVFKDLPLELDGNNVASYTVELTAQTPAVDDTEYLAPIALNDWTDDGAPPEHSNGDSQYAYPDGASIYFDTLADAVAAMQGDYPYATTFVGYYTSEDNLLSIADGGAVAGDARYVYLAYHYELPGSVVAGSSSNPCTAFACGSGGQQAVFDTLYNASGRAGHYGIGRFYPRDSSGGFTAPYPYSIGGDSCVACPPNGNGYFPVAHVIPFIFIRVERIPTLPASRCVPGDPAQLGIAELPGNPLFCISDAGELSPNVSYTLETGTFKQVKALAQNSTSVTQYPKGPVLRSTDPLYSDSAFWIAAAAAAGVSGTYGVDFPQVVTQAGVGTGTSSLVDASSIALEDLITQACAEGNYSAGQLDFIGDFSELVPGYLRTGQMRPRDVIEPLRPIYWFDMVEVDRKLVWVKRGGASVSTIGPDDLGASESDTALVNVVPTRAQETELPSEVTVSYMSRTRDYEAGSQSARRQVTTSRQKTAISAAIVLDDQKAADAASVVLYDMWTGRTGIEWSTTRKYAHLVPTDIVLLDDGVATYLTRITEASEEGPVIKWKGVLEHPSHYTPQAAAAELQAAQNAIHFVGPMKLALLDLPLLREVDDGSAGPYAGATGYLPSWSGGVAYRSADGGSSYGAVQDMTRKASLGIAQSRLPDFSGGNVVDEVSTVTVRMLGSATLSTITRAQLIDGGNAAALGVNGRMEILQFQRAELIAPRTYVLTGLLRARRGTEAYTGSHTSADLFALLDTNLYSLDDPVSVVGAEQQWKGVSFGTSVATAPEQDVTNQGVRLIPLSPVHLRASRQVDTGAVRFTWMRRTRYPTTLTGTVGITAPLGEAVEAYEVDIYTDATRTTVVRTLSSSVQFVDYTLAQQAADFGTPPADFMFSVRQLSATVGAGASSDGGAGTGGDLPGLPTVEQRAHYYTAALALTSMIDTRVVGAILHKGLLDPGIGEPNAFLVSSASGIPYSLNTSSEGWKVTGSGINTVTVTATGLTFNTAFGSNWLNPSGNVAIFLAGAGIFKLVEWTGDGSGARDIAHALGVAPALIFAKRNAVENWWMYSNEKGANYSARFPSSAGHAFAADATAFPALSTSANLKIGSGLNTSGQQYLALVFSGTSSEVSSGTYAGNGSATGPIVALGFKPALLLIRALGATLTHTFVTTSALETDAAKHWLIDDQGTSPSETAIVNLTATGFSVVTSVATVNESAITYHYWALQPT